MDTLLIKKKLLRNNYRDIVSLAIRALKTEEKVSELIKEFIIVGNEM